MRGYGPTSYGEGFADVYDDWYGDVTDATACADRCAALAAGVPGAGSPPVVLELGIGTGRLALPLRRRGCDVRGIDASPAMVARLRARPGGDGVPVHLGDLAEVVVPVGDADPDGSPPAVDLVLCAYNTLFNLPDAASQARCLAGVAAALRPGGRLVVEAFVPQPGAPADRGDEPGAAAEPDDGAEVRIRSLAADAVVLTAARHDAHAQVMEGSFVALSEADGVRLRPWRLHYLHPAQLDDLAAAAGLGLEHRWSGWDAAPLGPDDPTHVSVYRALPPLR